MVATTNFTFEYHHEAIGAYNSSETRDGHSKKAGELSISAPGEPKYGDIARSEEPTSTGACRMRLRWDRRRTWWGWT